MVLFFQVFDGKTDTENMVKIFCGSVAESVTSTTNVVYVRFYSEKNGLESRFDSIFTAMRALDSGVIADSCDPEVSFYFAGVPTAPRTHPSQIRPLLWQCAGPIPYGAPVLLFSSVFLFISFFFFLFFFNILFSF